MMQMAFYKGRTRLFDRLVQWWTRGPYSHCELVINGECYSASLRDGGVRSKMIDLASGRWDVMPLPPHLATTDHQADALIWFMAHAGAGYDVAGLFGFVLPCRAHSRRRWFCSEPVAEALGIKRSWTISPNSLAERVQAQTPRAADSGGAHG